MKRLIAILLLVISYHSFATIHVVGSGSGAVTINSMASCSCSPGDTVDIVGGTYTGYSTFTNLNNLLIRNQSGNVVQFTTGISIYSDSAVRFLGAGNTTRADWFGTVHTYGFYLTGSATINVAANLRKMYFGGFWAYKIGNIFNTSENNATQSYNGLVSTILVRYVEITNWTVDSCGDLIFGSQTSQTNNPFLYTNVHDSISVHDNIFNKSSGDGVVVYAAHMQRLNYYRNSQYLSRYRGPDPGLDLAAVDCINGFSGAVHDNYQINAGEQLLRAFGSELVLNGTGKVEFYNNISVSSVMYPMLQGHSWDQDSYDSSLTMPVNLYAYNNTCGDRKDSSVGGYISGLCWINGLPNGYTFYAKNNLMFNVANYGYSQGSDTTSIQYTNSLSNTNGTVVRSNNITRVSAPLAGILDSVNAVLVAGSPAIGAGTTPYVPLDIKNIPYTTNDIGAAAYVTACAGCLFRHLKSVTH